MKYLFSTFILLICSLSIWASSLPGIPELLAEAESANWETGVTESIIINAPLETVWEYGSDSNLAHEWSVFFDHITPLPGIADGQVGALRRCYRNDDENGPHWDEMTLKTIPYKFRQIVTFNLVGFRPTFFTKNNHVFVRQLYRAIDEHTTEMSFQTQYPKNATLRTKIGFKLTQHKSSKVFKQNLDNIKAAIERTPRPYPWY